MKGFKNFNYEYKRQEVTKTIEKCYGRVTLFTYQNNKIGEVYTGITNINKSILKLIPNKYINLAGGYNNLDVIGIKCTVCTVNEKVILLISLKNCKTFKLTITKKYLQENDSLGLLNVNPVIASIIYNDVKLFDFVLEDNHVDRNKTYNVYHYVTYHNGLSKFLYKTRDKINNISIENEGNFVKSMIMFNSREKIFAIKGKNIISSTGKVLGVTNIIEPALILAIGDTLSYGGKIIAKFNKIEEIQGGMCLKEITHINKSLVEGLGFPTSDDLSIPFINSINDTIVIQAEVGHMIYFSRVKVKETIYTAKGKLELGDELLELKTACHDEKEYDDKDSTKTEDKHKDDNVNKLDDDCNEKTIDKSNSEKEDNRIYIFNDRVLLGHKPICNFINYNKGSDSIEILEITNISEDILKIAGIDTNHKILVPKIEFIDDELMIVHLVDNGFKCNIRFSINNGLYFGPTKVDISEKYLNIPKEYYYELENNNTNKSKEDKANYDSKEDEVNSDCQENDVDIETIDKEELVELMIKLKSLEILKKHGGLISKLFTKEELKKKVDKLI